MDKDRVSRLCRELDEHVEQFRTRPLDGAYPYLWLDAKHVKVRDRGRVLPRRWSSPTAARHGPARGHRAGTRRGRERGVLDRVPPRPALARAHCLRLVVSDHHEGLKIAIARVLDAPWQRCCVHLVRNMHGHCRPSQRGMVSAALREVFNAPDQPEARRRVTALIDRLSDQVPNVCELLEAAEDDLVAFMAFPAAHRTSCARPIR